MADNAEQTKAVQTLRKGALVRAKRLNLENSLESEASQMALPSYIFEGPGEILALKDAYCQVRWRMPVPDVWLRIDQLELWS